MRGRGTLVFGAVGLLALAAVLVGAFIDPEQAARGWLLAWGYWIGIAVGGLLLLAITHAMSASWFVVIRRFAEAIAGTLVLLALLFLPVLFALDTLYPWAGSLEHFPEHVRHIIEHRHVYLNQPFFIARSVLFLAVFVVFAELLIRWSVRQDQSPQAWFPARLRRVGSVALPIVAIALTWATFDWFMSLEPAWFSTIYGIYWFGGGMAGAVALVALQMFLAERAGGPMVTRLSAAHYHNVGKLLFTFVVFWAYAGFSQLIITYMADLPEEVVWYLDRFAGGWMGGFVILAVGHFAIPFFILLSRDVKRNPAALAAMAVWILLMHAVDIYWTVMPSIDPTPGFPWMALAAWVAIGGLSTAFALWRTGRVGLVPEGDPMLGASLEYRSL